MRFLVNKECAITFDPFSLEFTERVRETFSELYETYQREVLSQNCFDIIALDGSFRGKIDALFDEPVCHKVFGETNVFLTAGGTPLWLNFMVAIINEIDRQLDVAISRGAYPPNGE